MFCLPTTNGIGIIIRPMESGSKKTLNKNGTRTKTILGAQLCNDLLLELCKLETHETFRKTFRTLLFKREYENRPVLYQDYKCNNPAYPLNKFKISFSCLIITLVTIYSIYNSV